MTPPVQRVQLPVSKFERLLLCGDAQALADCSLHDAAAVAKGDFDVFKLKSTHPSRSTAIAQQCLQTCSESVNLYCPALSDALQHASAGSHTALFDCYVAGVALLQAFIRENWTGPVDPKPNPLDLQQSENAAFFLFLDGEDVARPARYLHWLRAAKYILVDHIQEFTRNGALLAPWWATRALLAHHFVLSGPTPTLQYNIFTMYCRFMGSSCSETRFLFGAGPQAQPTPPETDDEDEFLLPAPVAEGDTFFAEEEQQFIQALDENIPEDRELLILANLELSLAQKSFYDGDGALASLRRATRISGLHLQVKGEMGIRTKYQTKPTAQLIARAFQHLETSEEDVLKATEDKCSVWKFPVPGKPIPNSGEDGDDDGNHEKCTGIESLEDLLPKNVPVNDSDVLGYIKLVEENIPESKGSELEIEDDGEDEPDEENFFDNTPAHELEDLSPLQQAITLGHAAIVKARNASHTLTREQMAPYVDLVIRNAASVLGTSSVVQIRALMLRVTFERERGRYLERCMSQMEELGRFIDVDLQGEPNLYTTAAAERTLYVFGSAMPPRWELKKELAISFGKIGLVKSAMEIFEKLEYWDELVDCHRLIGNIGAAESLVREQLEILDRDVLEEGIVDEEIDMVNIKNIVSRRAVNARASRRPRLLCVLSDVMRTKEHYETAWKESGFRYARAKRALGRMCVEAGEWEEAVGHFKEALAINSLFPDIWFTYGCAAIEVKNMQLAAHAFTRVVQQTPEHGEAWNNLGRVLYDLGKKREALSALIQSAKMKRDSWRIWQNVLTLATETRSTMDILRALERLLELQGKDGVAAQPIGVAVAEVIRMSSSEDAEDKALVGPACRKLLKVLGRSTALVSTNPSIWAAYAELHELVPSAGGVQKAFDCRLKQVRSLIAHGRWKSEVREFRHMAIASDALVKDALATGNSASIRAAELHLASVIEQTSYDFKEDEGFLRLLEVSDSLHSEGSTV